MIIARAIIAMVLLAGCVSDNLRIQPTAEVAYSDDDVFIIIRPDGRSEVTILAEGKLSTRLAPGEYIIMAATKKPCMIGRARISNLRTGKATVTIPMAYIQDRCSLTDMLNYIAQQ